MTRTQPLPPTRSTAPAAPRDRLVQAGLGACLVLGAVLAYLPVARAAFIWDDDDYVTQNRALLSTQGLRAIWLKPGVTPQYYPLVFTTFWLEHKLYGLHPLGYHFINVAIHAASSVVLWRLLRRLEIPAALLGAMLFAVHPVHAESVAWVTERKNVLSGLMYLLSGWAFLRFAPPAGPSDWRRWRWYAGAIVLMGGALLSKTVSCTLPVALALVLWWKRPRLQGRDLAALLPMLALGACFGLLTIWMEKIRVGARGIDWQLSPVDRVLIAGRAAWFYLVKLAWPARLTFIYPKWQIDAGIWWQYLFPLSLAGVLAALWLGRRRIGKAPLVAALFFLATLLPALGFFNVYPMRYSYVADHFQYLASIGPIALAAGAAGVGMRRLKGQARLVLAGALVLWPILLAGLTFRQTLIYRDSQGLWNDTLAKNPSAWIAHGNLGMMCLDRGELDKAMEHFRQELSIREDIEESHASLATVLERQGRYEEALAHRRRCVELRPDLGTFRALLAGALVQMGRLEEAQQQARQAVQLAPHLPDPYNNLGLALFRQRRFGEAEDLFRRALAIEPGSVQARQNLAELMFQSGRPLEAIQILEDLLRQSPTPRAYYALGLIYMESRQMDQAAAAFVQQLQMEPGNGEVWKLLGNCHAVSGRMAEAAAAYQQAILHRPGDSALRNNLGVVLEGLDRLVEAEQQFRQAIQLEPFNLEAHYNLSRILAKASRLDEARRHLEEVLRINPDYSPARADLERLGAPSQTQGAKDVQR